MSRKSRKANTDIQKTFMKPVTVGYVRLSVSKEESNHSIENQKLIIESWAEQQKTIISHFYVDDGFSGSNYERPAFQELLQDIKGEKVNCVVVKDLSRLGRNLIETGYYIEMFFPSHKVRFVSVNDQFDTIDGINNQLGDFKVCVSFTNAFHEETALDIKKKTETALDYKAQRGLFIGARAPFGYKKSEVNHNKIVIDEEAAKIVKKIFELATNNMGLTEIVRYLNENHIPTPMQYARAKGLTGKYNDGSGNWNTRSVKHILTNSTYTGILIQGKNKRIVENTHEALIDSNSFKIVQKNLQSKISNVETKPQSTENLLKGKIICGCCGRKMQRKRGTNHADWYFFTCNTNNRIATGMCTGMYIREEEIFHAIYKELGTEIATKEIINNIEEIRVYQRKKVSVKWSELWYNKK